MDSSKRALPPDANGPRFRIVRVCDRVIIGDEDAPAAAMARVFKESDHVVAVDRRGYIYANNHKERS